MTIFLMQKMLIRNFQKQKNLVGKNCCKFSWPLSTAPRFKNTKARTVTNCDKFTRGVSFKSSIKRNVVDK